MTHSCSLSYRKAPLFMRKHWNLGQKFHNFHTGHTWLGTTAKLLQSLSPSHRKKMMLSSLYTWIYNGNMLSSWLVCMWVFPKRLVQIINRNTNSFLQVNICKISQFVRVPVSNFQAAAGTNAKSQECISKRIRHNTSFGAVIVKQSSLWKHGESMFNTGITNSFPLQKVGNYWKLSLLTNWPHKIV